MPKVLVVSPHFPPTNAPDHQRIRMALPYLAALGWQATVLAVDSRFVEAPKDPLLESTLPPEIRVVRSKAVPQERTRHFGFGGLALRSYPYLRRDGSTLLSEGGYDVVFFSTSLFPAMTLGPVWRTQFGIPYVLDFQDPLHSDYYRRHNLRPPGGRIKYGLSNLFTCLFEHKTIRNAAYIVSVSREYLDDLHLRYPDTAKVPSVVLPFGASARDFRMLEELNIRQRFFEPGNTTNIVHVGRSDRGLHRRILTALFTAAAAERDAQPVRAKALRFWFIGTSYEQSSRAHEVRELAAQYRLEDIVVEEPNRVPYFESLRLMSDASVVLILGSEDTAYNPSKVYPCLQSGRPILAILREESPAVLSLRASGIRQVVTFKSDTTPSELSAAVRNALEELLSDALQPTVPRDLGDNSAEGMAKRLCEVFEKIS